MLILSDCEYTCHHKCRQLVTLDCANVTADGKYAEKPSKIEGETSLVEDTSQAVRICLNICVRSLV